jgi:hypothetical protein
MKATPLEVVVYSTMLDLFEIHYGILILFLRGTGRSATSGWVVLKNNVSMQPFCVRNYNFDLIVKACSGMHIQRIRTCLIYKRYMTKFHMRVNIVIERFIFLKMMVSFTSRIAM